MRIVIGITQDPKRIQALLAEYEGRKDTLVELGPFISERDACSWLKLIKSKISGIKEIPSGQGQDDDKLWYGFTFEQMTD
ncbi:MAG: hypothetical protein PHI97_03655 [Desulfobulbus sp.]|nr:hypothetical protein [Desulfobulbus sp.]